jgi:hypothetical protein
VTIQNETRRAGGATGSRGMSFLDRIDTRANSTTRLRFQRLVEKLHALGPAPLAYFIIDVKRGGDVDSLLERYAALPADFIAAYRGDRFAPSLRAMDGGAP